MTAQELLEHLNLSRFRQLNLTDAEARTLVVVMGGVRWLRTVTTTEEKASWPSCVRNQDRT